MPATVTLATTTLTSPVGVTDNIINLADTTGLFKGLRLYVDGEMMKVMNTLSLLQATVARGVDGTGAAAHPSGVTIYIGRADQFYERDPIGAPPAVILVSPYINVIDGRVWFAQGDASSTGTSNRYWTQQTNTHTGGELGFRTSTLDPTSST